MFILPGVSRSAAQSRSTHPLALSIISTAALVLMCAAPRGATADCSNAPGIPLGNVIWGLVDTVAACPAGDSVFTGRPCRLRIWISYSDANCNPKVGVPPESIWVNIHATTSNLKVNDEGTYIYADDSTDANGYARVTIPSFSGNGLVSVGASVSGKFQGYKTATVRTTDTNADGRSDASDLNCSRCWADINYDGKVDGADSSLIIAHSSAKHWHRNVLYGTLVKITTACPTCDPNSLGQLGDGDLSWSPNGRMAAISLRDANEDCAVNLIPTDPAVGTIPYQLSFPPLDNHDYSPSWSPLGATVFWSRRDHALMFRGVPGRSADTTADSLTVSPSRYYQTDASISPDGTTLAFAGGPQVGEWRIYTVPATGGTVTQVTPNASGLYDDYPKWSPDGSRIIFFRYGAGTSHCYEVPAGGGTPIAVTQASGLYLPSYHPDGATIVMSAPGPTGYVHMATLDSTVANAAGLVGNYTDYVDYSHWAAMSYDGTRLMMVSAPPGQVTQNRQAWAARRNMNSPPSFTAFGGEQLVDTTISIPVSVVQGLAYSATVSAADPENDPLAYSAMFLRQDLGMAFDPATRTFSWTPPSGTSGQTYNVKFLVDTPSGGTDSFIAQFAVTAPVKPAQATRASVTDSPSIRLDSPNPVRERLTFVGNFTEYGATLAVYDPAGRSVASLSQHSADRIAWDLRGPNGNRVEPGVYFYRARSGGILLSGKVVVVR